MEDYKYSYRSKNNEDLSIAVYRAGFQRCPPNYNMQNINRDHFLIHHIVKGKGSFTVDSTTYDLVEGDTFIVFPFTEVSYCADGDDPWEYYWVGFNGSDAQILLNKTDFTLENPVIKYDFKGKLKNALLNIYNARGNDICDNIHMAGYLYIALSLIIKKSTMICESSTHTKYARKATTYITYNYSSQITVNDISTYVGVSRSQLYRIFMEVYGVSPIKYLTDYRVRQACNMIKNTNFPINTIATSVGFADSLYFSKAFRKSKGISPKEYRKTLLKPNSDLDLQDETNVVIENINDEIE